MKKQTAFSLIELSIVILIIGILIAGVTQGSRLVTAMKLNTARTTTQSSPVASMTSLVLWLETSMEDSFLTTEANDGTQLSQWNDRNPQRIAKYYALKTATAATTYVEKSVLNSLPSVYFDGSVIANGGYFSLSSTTSIANATFIPMPGCTTSFFIVSKSSNLTGPSAQMQYLFSNGDNGSLGYSYGINGTGAPNTRELLHYGINDRQPSIATTTNLEITSYTYAGSGNAPKVYVNGNASTPLGAINCNDPTGNLYIGYGKNATNVWSGYISEIIMFDKSLNDADRKSVEKYLGQKYAIKVTT